MVAAIFILFVMVTGFIMAYAVLAEPIDLIVDSLTGAHTETGDEIGDTMDLIKFAFGAAIVVGIVFAIILFIVYGHKKEYE